MAAAFTHTSNATAPEGLGIGIGLGIPLVEKLHFNDALPQKSTAGFGMLGMGYPSQQQQHTMRWPYSTRYKSTTFSGTTVGGYDSSPTPSDSSCTSSSSDSDFSLRNHAARRVSGSATHDVLLSYLSPTLSTTSSVQEGGGEVRKVYLLSSGLRQPTTHHRRYRSETFRFPLPPSKSLSANKGLPLKSALRSAAPKDYSLKKRKDAGDDGVVSPPLRAASSVFRREAAKLSPQIEEGEDLSEEAAGRQGWSPYSSIAPTPRQVSGGQTFSLRPTSISSLHPSDVQHDNIGIRQELSCSSAAMVTHGSAGAGADLASPPSSCSSRTLVSDNDETTEDSGAETDPNSVNRLDAAKLARLHASLFLLDNRVPELPLSLAQRHNPQGTFGTAELGGSVEEKMAYLCGLGYRYRKKTNGTKTRHARKGSGDFASQHAQEARSEWWDGTHDDVGEAPVEAALETEEEMREGKVESYAPTIVGVNKAVRVISNCASAVTSSCSSPIMSGLLSASRSFDHEQAKEEEMEVEGDETIRPSEMFLPEPIFDGALLDSDEFSYLIDGSLLADQQESEQEARKEGREEMRFTESGLMTPPLTTPELGLDGLSPMLLDQWPSPPQSTATFKAAAAAAADDADTGRGAVDGVQGCRPYSTCSSVNPFQFSLSPLAKPQANMLMSNSVSCPISLWNPSTTHFGNDNDDDEEQEAEPEGKEEDITIERAARKIISATPVSVLTRPRPLRSSNSNNSLFSAASSDHLQKPTDTISMLSRPRPVPPRAGLGHTIFATKATHGLIQRSKTSSSLPTSQPGPKNAQGTVSKSVMTKSMSATTMPPTPAPVPKLQVKVPQRKSSLDVRAEAQLHQRAEEQAAESELTRSTVHPNSISRDVGLHSKYHSSASPYLHPHSTVQHHQPHQPQQHHQQPALQRDPRVGQEKGGERSTEICASAASAAKARRHHSKVKLRDNVGGSMVKSCSLPVLFTARTPAQRAAGETGLSKDEREKRLKSVVFAHPSGGHEGRIEPPKDGILVVSEQVTTVGLAL